MAINELLPLKVNPGNFDVPGVMRAAQQYKAGEMQNQLAGMKVDAAADQFGAEKNFRDRSAAGDPNADEALAGYPDMRQKVMDAFDGMNPADYKAAKKKALRFGDAARNILMFRDGSPEQADAWNKEITGLANDKIIDPGMADNLIKSGPNPLLIDEALSVEEFAKSHGSKAQLEQEKTDLANKRENRLLDNTNADNVRADENLAIAKERLGIARDRADSAADRIQAQIDKGVKDIQGKQDRADDTLGIKIEQAVGQYRKDLGLDKPELETYEPEKYAKLNERLDAYQTRLFNRFGFGPDGKRLRSRALGADKVENDTAPPAAPQNAKGDNYPIGSTATGKDGQKLKKTERGWEPL